MQRRALGSLIVLAFACSTLLPSAADAGRRRGASHEAIGGQLFASPQASPVTQSGDYLYVANTTSHTVDFIHKPTGVVTLTVQVGIEPVTVAVKPDGSELWVSNHISDTVSVIDIALASPDYGRVIETIQDLNSTSGTTNFDQPVGIAFASNSKAYVALSSSNRIAIIDAVNYVVTGHIQLHAQDPRALTTSPDGSRLYALPFESGNQSELSVCLLGGTPQCTFGLLDLLNAAADPNLTGIPKNIVVDPDLPDRDLYVIDTSTDTVLDIVTGVGTLLYDVVATNAGDVFITNTEARNNAVDGNGLAALPPDGLSQGLIDLENRIFRNRLTYVDCSSIPCSAADARDLEEPPGTAVADPLATPYGIDLSTDGTRAVITAAASNKIALIDAANHDTVLDSLVVGDIPRGLVWDSTGSEGTVWVLNTLGNSVTRVDVTADAFGAPTTIAVGDDPTPSNVRLGRIAFNTAEGSSSKTFACASCHPDANVDQLLWFIGATCSFFGCDQEEQRSTMPLKGLRNTLPLHWDGVLGDPIGGINGEVGVGGFALANCTVNGADQQECFLGLVDAATSGVMCDQDPVTNPAGCPPGGSELSQTERDNMALFHEAVAYSPAPDRRIDDVFSAQAMDGFADFFLDQGGNGGGLASTCANTLGGCHEFPHGTSTNSVVVGAFESPTMRGMWDRWLQFSGGFTNPQEVQDLTFALGDGQPPTSPPLTRGEELGVKDWRANNPGGVMDELTVFSVAFVAFNTAYNNFPDDQFQMFREAGTGFSGATGRQVTLNQNTALLQDTIDLMDELEAADTRGVVNLRAVGRNNGVSVTYSFRDGSYRTANGAQSFSGTQLRANADAGDALLTLTAELRSAMGQSGTPMPILDVEFEGPGSSGNDPDIPELAAPPHNVTFRVLDLLDGATLLVDGQLTGGTISCDGSYSPFCDGPNTADFTLDTAPVSTGLHVLQVQNPAGPLSNEMLLCVGDIFNDCL